MASEIDKLGKATLSKPEDWEQWYEELQGVVSSEFWPLVDPDQPESVPMQPPRRPEVWDLNQAAQNYTDLSATHQKAFDGARKHYADDLKLYSRQETALKEIRQHILDTVVRAKKQGLRANQPIEQWLTYLRDSTKPPEGHMRVTVKQRYDNLFRLPRSKPLTWLDQWEDIIHQAVKYNLSDLEDGVWLYQLANWLAPLSSELALQLKDRAEDQNRRKITEFPNVVRRVRDHLKQTTKQNMTVRGGAFEASLGPDEDAYEAIADQFSRSTKRQRASTKTEHNPPKRKQRSCLACDRKGHDLKDCWVIFPNLRPSGFQPSTQAIEKVKEKIAADKKLRRQVEELQQQKETEFQA